MDNRSYLKKIKILFIHHATGWGGAPLNMINIINSLDKRLFQIEVLLLKDSIVSKKLKENNIQYKIAASWFYRKFYKYYDHTLPGFIKWYMIKTQFICCLSWILSHSIFAKQELRNIDYDIVHLNSSVLTDWLEPCNKKGKVIIHIQEPLAEGYWGIRYRFFTNQIRKYADRIIAISNDNATRVNIPLKTTVVYNYSIVEDLNDLDIENYQTKTVLYLGGESEIKGFYILANALKYINNDIKVLFAGNYRENFINNTDIKKKSKELIKKILHYKNEVFYNKIINDQKAIKIGLISDVNGYLDKSVCLVSPFIVPHFSRPIIEAFGRRKPAIATKIDGMDEVINNGQNGILVENNNARALAKAINYLCENPEIAKEMGNLGYRDAKIIYSQKNIEKIIDIYAALTLS